MATLRQLRDLHHYRACEWDLKADPAGHAFWDELFRWHLDEVLLPLIRQEYPGQPEPRYAAFRTAYLALFDDVRTHPERYERIDILMFDERRHAVLRDYGFPDPFRTLKERENSAALRLLPDVFRELDAAPPEARQELLVRGLMAGNMVDLGARATVAQHRAGLTAFRHARTAQPARPWHYDDVAAWWARLAELNGSGRHAVMFVDNSGADIVLGCLPFVRELLRHGLRVTLAANSVAALNDVIAAELVPVLHAAAESDADFGAAWRSQQLTALGTGNTAPLIDLTTLDDAFVTAVADADIVMLHGMGRSVESNWDARFNCDVLRTAVVKDERVAARIDGQLFDCVFRFVPAHAHPSHA